MFTLGKHEKFIRLILLDSQTLEEKTDIKFDMKSLQLNGSILKRSPQIVPVKANDSKSDYAL